jgi:hypothetical protein
LMVTFPVGELAGLGAGVLSSCCRGLWRRAGGMGERDPTLNGLALPVWLELWGEGVCLLTRSSEADDLPLWSVPGADR